MSWTNGSTSPGSGPGPKAEVAKSTVDRSSSMTSLTSTPSYPATRRGGTIGNGSASSTRRFSLRKVSSSVPTSPTCPISLDALGASSTPWPSQDPLNSSITATSPQTSARTSGDSSTRPTTPTTPTTPTSDSRIPRPSPTALRRSLSMRLRGERFLSGGGGGDGGAHQIYQLRSTPAATSALHGHQYQRPQNHLPKSQQSQQLPQAHHYHRHHLPHHQPLDQRVFPVITENGTESPRQRSFSLSLTPARPRSGHAASSSTHGPDDSDLDSVRSYGSACSTASACDHATFALNGTTWSGRSKKYVVHCSNLNSESEQYLTPTQRAARQIRKFQALLKEAKKEIDEKDREICRLTKEVVELRLYKASLNSPDERTDSSDALTVRESNPFSPESPCKDLPEEAPTGKLISSPDTPEKRVQADLPSSLADSGHFEDGSVHSKDSGCLLPEATLESTAVASSVVDAPSKVHDSVSISGSGSGSGGDGDGDGDGSNAPVVGPSDQFSETLEDSFSRDEERRRLVDLYENRIEEVHRRHVDELQELKQKHNDKVESLLTQLAEVNTRYCQVRPSVDAAESRARELETELEAVKSELAEQKSLLAEQEERNKQMYLKMYTKGQEAARIEQADQILEQASLSPPKVTVAELLQQLTVTQAELENVKDTSYSPEPHISAECSQNLLSAQEAVSLWVLGTRKAMYRRIVEARSSQGTLDPEITLQFLKSAIYYFLTDKENHQGHLNAIESILGFSDAEKHNIDKFYRSARK